MRSCFIGDPKYRIPVLEPLTISQMKIVQGTKQVGMTMECYECKLYGLSETNFTSARFEYPIVCFSSELVSPDSLTFVLIERHSGSYLGG